MHFECILGVFEVWVFSPLRNRICIVLCSSVIGSSGHFNTRSCWDQSTPPPTCHALTVTAGSESGAALGIRALLPTARTSYNYWKLDFKITCKNKNLIHFGEYKKETHVWFSRVKFFSILIANTQTSMDSFRLCGEKMLNIKQFWI